MSKASDMVLLVVVGGALLCPLLDDAIALRGIANFVAFGIALASFANASTTHRGVSGDAAQQAPPTSIATLSPGRPGTVAGAVLTKAEQPSWLSDDRFVAFLASVVRLDDNIGARVTPVFSRWVGDLLELRDATGVADVRLTHVRIYGTVHRTVEWNGEGLAFVPEGRLRDALASVGAPLEGAELREEAGAARFRYTEIAIREDDQVVVTADVLEVTDQPGRAQGYREKATERRAILTGTAASPVRIRSVSPELLAAMKSRAERSLGIGLALVAWGVAVWFVPSIF